MESKENLDKGEKEILKEFKGRSALIMGYLDKKENRDFRPPMDDLLKQEYMRGYEIRLQQETTSVAQERKARKGA